jgi:hypothetical protein
MESTTPSKRCPEETPIRKSPDRYDHSIGWNPHNAPGFALIGALAGARIGGHHRHWGERNSAWCRAGLTKTSQKW